jgi:hypothetical protein
MILLGQNLEPMAMSDRTVDVCAAIGIDNAAHDADEWMWFCMHEFGFGYICVPGDADYLYFPQCWRRLDRN